MHGRTTIKMWYVCLLGKKCCLRQPYIDSNSLPVTINGCFKVDSHTACRAHAVPLPCRAARGLECVFPSWFKQCGCVWFTLAMPCPCHAPTMPFFSRPRHSTAVEIWPVGYLPAFGFFRLPRGVPRRLLSETYQSSSQRPIPTTVKSGSSTIQKVDMLNCWTSSSEIFGYHADFHEGHATVGAWQGRSMAHVN
jgi:hypothetical protein